MQKIIRLLDPIPDLESYKNESVLSHSYILVHNIPGCFVLTYICSIYRKLEVRTYE